MPLILLEEDQITLYKERGKYKTILRSNIKKISFETNEEEDTVILVLYLQENIIVSFYESLKNIVLRVFMPMDNIHGFVLTCADKDVQVLKMYFEENSIVERNVNQIKQDYYMIGRSFYILSIRTYGAVYYQSKFMGNYNRGVLELNKICTREFYSRG